MRKIYNKLVRDKIPQIISSNNGTPCVSVLNNERYLEELNTKLNEELKEYLESGEELVIAEGKTKEAQSVIDYLRYLELERQIINLQQQGVDLSNEEKSVNAEIISLQDNSFSNCLSFFVQGRFRLQGKCASSP